MGGSRPSMRALHSRPHWHRDVWNPGRYQPRRGCVIPWRRPSWVRIPPPAPRERPMLKCPVCSGTEFDKESGFVTESFPYSGHNIVLAVCRRCHFVLQFYSGKTIFGVLGERDSHYSEIRDMLDT